MNQIADYANHGFGAARIAVLGADFKGRTGVDLSTLRQSQSCFTSAIPGVDTAEVVSGSVSLLHKRDNECDSQDCC
jgi:hypothetical protein